VPLVSFQRAEQPLGQAHQLADVEGVQVHLHGFTFLSERAATAGERAKVVPALPAGPEGVASPNPKLRL
jgi:hypothetical protein